MDITTLKMLLKLNNKVHSSIEDKKNFKHDYTNVYKVVKQLDKTHFMVGCSFRDGLSVVWPSILDTNTMSLDETSVAISERESLWHEYYDIEDASKIE